MAHKPDPHDVIRRIESEVYDFRRDYTEAPRLLRQHLGLVDSETHISNEEHEESMEERSEEFDKLQEERNDLHDLVQGIRDHLESLDPEDCENHNVRRIAEVIGKLIQDTDTDIPCDVGRITDAIAKAAWSEESRKESTDGQPERSGQLGAGTKAWLDHLGVPLTSDAHLSPKFPTADGYKFDEPIVSYLFRDGCLVLHTPTGELTILEPGGPVMRDTMIHHISPPKPEPEAPAKHAGKLKATREKNAATGPPVLTRTPKGKALELRFDGIPAESLRDDMKLHGFRWSRKRQAWLAGYSEDALVYAAGIAECDPSPLRRDTQASEPEPTPAAPDPAPSPAPTTQPGTKPTRRIPGGFSI